MKEFTNPSFDIRQNNPSHYGTSGTKDSGNIADLVRLGETVHSLTGTAAEAFYQAFLSLSF